MDQAEIIDYLKIKTGGKLVMTPQQLEQEIGISTKQQSVLRTQQRFPIPHKQIGRSVLYSILHIADFLIAGEVYMAPNKKYEPKPAPKISRSKSSQDLSHLFLLRVKQRAILSRLGVETAFNSFHLSVSLSSVLAGDFWSDLYGHDL